MTKPYSEDLRIRVVEAVANGMSRRQAARLFKLGASSAIRWADQHDQTGTVAAKPIGGSGRTSITEAIVRAAKAGEIGDGRIFVLDLDRAVRISTGTTDGMIFDKAA